MKLPDTVWIVTWRVRNPGYWQQKGIQKKLYLDARAAKSSYTYHANKQGYTDVHIYESRTEFVEVEA